MTDLPTDRSYTTEHEWVQIEEQTARVGVTEFAATALGDIVYVDLPTVGTAVTAGSACAELESTKSVSDVYAPVAGVIVSVNDQLSDSPETINADPYLAGWLFEIEMSAESSAEDLLNTEAYVAHLASSSD